MARTPYDLGDIVRRFRSDLEAAETLTSVQGRALSAIGLCRTAALGGHQCVCLDCGQKEDPSYNSCRNRNCPKCQGLTQERWIAARTRAILPIPHFHAVFTLPAQLRPLARIHPVAIYDLMFRCVAATLLEMGQSRLGITLGLTMVLHTWTRKLTYHVHLHVLVTAGGLTLDGEAFKTVEERFLLHVKPLASLFKGKLMDGLRDLHKAGLLAMTDGAFGSLMATLWKLDWHVYLKEAFKSPEWVLEYLGRYTHRIGIANSRLLEVTPERITFRTKGQATETVHPVEFLRRFVQHVLPDRLKKDPACWPLWFAKGPGQGQGASGSRAANRRSGTHLAGGPPGPDRPRRHPMPSLRRPHVSASHPTDPRKPAQENRTILTEPAVTLTTNRSLSCALLWWAELLHELAARSTSRTRPRPQPPPGGAQSDPAAPGFQTVLPPWPIRTGQA